jgi:hypothetical protein
MILVDTNKIVTGSQRGSKHYKCIYLEYLDRVRKFEFSMKNFDNIRQFNVCISLLFFALYLLIISLWCLGRENNVKQFHESSFTIAKYKCTCKCQMMMSETIFLAKLQRGLAVEEIEVPREYCWC